MSFTLDNLRAAREALLHGGTLEAMKHINLLINRREALLKAQKHYSPSGLTRMEEPVNFGQMQKTLDESGMWNEKPKRRNNVDNRSTEDRPEESPGQQ